MSYAKRGQLDALNCRELYPSSAPFGIPSVPRFDGDIPERFVAWPNRKRAGDRDGLHFFVDDTRFEPVWRNPGRSRRAYEGRVVCSPDFSLYPEWPRAALLWNVYRARWTARALAVRGALVIPSVSWAPGFEDAFCGLPTGGTVAVSAYGARRAGEAYRAGYEAMCDTVRPDRVLVVGGAMPDWLAADERVTYRASGTIADRR